MALAFWRVLKTGPISSHDAWQEETWRAGTINIGHGRAVTD
jgi:hypothetical protein